MYFKIKAMSQTKTRIIIFMCKLIEDLFLIVLPSPLGSLKSLLLFLHRVRSCNIPAVNAADSFLMVIKIRPWHIWAVRKGAERRKTEFLHNCVCVRSVPSLQFPQNPHGDVMQEGNYCNIATLSSNNHTDLWGLCHFLPHNMEDLVNRLLP